MGTSYPKFRVLTATISHRGDSCGMDTTKLTAIATLLSLTLVSANAKDKDPTKDANNTDRNKQDQEGKTKTPLEEAGESILQLAQPAAEVLLQLPRLRISKLSVCTHIRVTIDISVGFTPVFA